MKLFAHTFDGRRSPVKTEAIYTYKAALDLARAHFRFSTGTAALYLQADGSDCILRTYVRAQAPGEVDVFSGYLLWSEPQAVYPKSLPDLDFSAIEDRICAAEEQADRKGYERGFKVGIAHRNRERAVQLRKQADSLERTAAYLSPTGRTGLVFQKGTVCEDVGTRTGRWSCGRRPEFTVDLGHNRR